MNSDPLEAARLWARELPGDFAQRLADALREGPAALRVLRASAVLPDSAEAVRKAFMLVEEGQSAVAGGALSALLDMRAREPTISPVWTGPESGQSGGRLTLAVLADLLGEASREILLVSYATLPSAEIRAALAAAADRGVEVLTLLESEADNPKFNGHGDPFPGIRAGRLSWPGHVRPTGASMHAKVLVVDRKVALVGSANLTGYGLERNLECGLLVRGGPVPAAIAEHLLNMRELEALAAESGTQHFSPPA